MTDKNTLKKWFVTAAIPPQEQFWAWMDSYWHKDDKIPQSQIEGLAETLGNKADAEQLNALAQTNASNLSVEDVEKWKAALSVGELPDNIATYNPLLLDFVMMKDGTEKPAGDLGKNVANSNPTSVAGAGLTLGANWTLNTFGYYYNITNLPDKSVDATFNRMLVQNNTGQVATTNGKTLLNSLPSLLTDAEKTAWKTQMNGGWTTNTMSVNLLMPLIIEQGKDRNNYFILRGANLNLPPTSFSVEIMAEDGVTSIATIPNSQVQLQTSGLELIFYYNTKNIPVGKFKVRLWNGVSYYTTPMFFNVLDSTNINYINISSLVWDVLENPDYNNGSSFNGGGLSLKSKAGNDGFGIQEPIVSGKTQAIFNPGDNFYIEIQVHTNPKANSDANPREDSNQSWLKMGVGYYDNNNSLAWLPINWFQLGKLQMAAFMAVGVGNNVELSTKYGSTNQSLSFTSSIYKVGNVLTAVFSDKIYTANIDENKALSIFAQLSALSVEDSLSISITNIYKF